MRKILTKVIWVTIIILVIVLANAGTLIVFLSPQTVAYVNQPFPLSRDTYRYGDIIEMKVIRCNSSDDVIPLTSNRSFVNVDTEEVFTVPNGSAAALPGCHDISTTLNFEFPPSMKSGRYKVQGIATVRTKIKTYDVIWESQPFNYIAKDS